jgi:zinc transporter 9
MSESNKANTGRMALCLVTGFILMVIVEQLVAPKAHSHTNDTLPLHKTNNPHEPATHIEGLTETESSRRSDLTSVDDTSNIHRSPCSEKGFSLLLGLVIHAAADGLALGVANLARSKDGNPDPVSSIVFLALMLHKGNSLLSSLCISFRKAVFPPAPTSLAFTTSLLSTNLPRPTCKKYVAIFSASTPLSAILSYFIFQFLGSGDQNDVTGTALLISVR